MNIPTFNLSTWCIRKGIETVGGEGQVREVFWGTEGVHVFGVGVEVERGEQGQEKVGGEMKGDSKF